VLDELRDRIARDLSTCRVAIVIPSVAAWPSAVLVRYRLPEDDGKRALELDCLLPRWADATYHLEQESKLLLIIPDLQGDELRWLQVQGTARPMPAAGWAAWLSAGASGDWLQGRYLAMRVTPQRIDLVDEGQAWGVSETLDL
jgi:hypothetical protein